MGLALAGVQYGGELVQLTGPERPDVQHVDVGAAVLELLLAVIHVAVQAFDLLVTKDLSDRLQESLKCERERRLKLLQLGRICERDQLLLDQFAD